MSNPNNFYINYSGGFEPNMRQEMINTLDGRFPEIAKGSIGFIRQMQKESNGKLKLCPCVDRVTKEPDKDVFCPICYGEGYIWKEVPVDYYIVRIGSTSGEGSLATADKNKLYGIHNIPLAVMYMKYNVDVEQHDKIVEIELDPAGAIIRPVKRIRVWRIQQLVTFRADNAKLEFTKLFLSLEDVKHLNEP